MGRVIDVGAAEFATVRAVLKLSQGEFAERLGLSRRTVIRGEQRGIELPPSWQSRDQPDGLRAKWDAAVREAEAEPARYVEAAKSDTIAKILEKMSQDEKDTRRGYYYYGRSGFVESFRHKVETLAARDIKPRAKVSPARGKSSKSKQRKKLARRKK